MAAAAAAPSADNRPVFELCASGNTLSLVASPELLAASIGRRVLGLISIGAAAENVVLRAARLGVISNSGWQLNDWPNPCVAQLACREGDGAEDSLEPAIPLRHSNRHLFFRGPVLSEGLQNKFSACAEGISGVQLAWLDTPSRRKRALQLIRWAETERFCNEELHSELFGSIRFDIGWSQPALTGLAPSSLGLAWFERGPFSLLRHWRLQRLVNLMGAHHIIALRAADLPCRLAPHICAITAVGELEQAAFRAGRLLERIWLCSTNMGLSMQVFAASAVYAIDGCAPIAAGLQSRLVAGWRELCPGGTPYLVFRMGFARRPTVRSVRTAPVDSA